MTEFLWNYSKSIVRGRKTLLHGSKARTMSLSIHTTYVPIISGMHSICCKFAKMKFPVSIFVASPDYIFSVSAFSHAS